MKAVIRMRHPQLCPNDSFPQLTRGIHCRLLADAGNLSPYSIRSGGPDANTSNHYKYDMDFHRKFGYSSRDKYIKVYKTESRVISISELDVIILARLTC